MHARQFRDALGKFPTGVCLITLVDEQGRARALTANSFASVSLDPPLVLWSLQKVSEIYTIFAAKERYAINVMTIEQEALSSQYAMKGDHFMDEDHFTSGKNGAPILVGALAFFECELAVSHDAGDHTILVGRVTEFQAASVGEPLVFHGGAYRELSPG